MSSLIKTYFIVLLIFFCLSANGQSDSIPIFPFALSEANLVKNESSFNQQKVMSGSRTLQDVDDLPLTIYVITKEEIQRYGFVTLVDALKHLPGIQVSQPGSALDGETFQMRGLRGNSYAKILINNVPIKPIIASSMPLGAQLPIQQAERIEVIYGPAAAVYGADASAGVINIILEKTDRPTFVQARLNAGNKNGYTDLNLIFGGKLGRNKHVVNFSVYGSTTILNDRSIIYDFENNYTPTDYVRQINSTIVDTSYVSLRNYTSDKAGEANFSTIPHLSRMFGADIYYKNWHLNFQKMYRRDHSAIGLHPLAISYDNPLNYFGEDITSINVGRFRSKEKSSLEVNFSALRYEVDNRSSSQLIRNSLNEGMNLIARSAALDSLPGGGVDVILFDSLRTQIYDRYFSGNRYSYAESTEFGTEMVYTRNIKPWLEFSYGANLRLGVGKPLTTLAKRPITVEDTIKSPSLPLQPIAYFGGGISSFIQAYFKKPKWNMTLGLQFYAFGSLLGDTELPGQSGINPRLTFLYKLNPKLSLRTFYGTAFRVPSPYYYVNTFRLNSGTKDILSIAALPLQSELTTAFEIGARWNANPQFKIDLVGFSNNTQNIISYNFNFNIQSLADINSIVGYFNNRNDALSFTGFQASFDYKNLVPSINLDARLNMQYARSFKLKNKNELVLFEVPIWSAAGMVSIKPLPKLTISALGVIQGKPAKDLERIGNFILDGVIGYDLSDRFQGLIKINNVFNTVYEGLLASNSPDDLFYNPQALRTIQVGLSYRTN